MSYPSSMVTSTDISSGHGQWGQLGGWPHLQPPASSAGVSDSVVVSTTSSLTINGAATKGAASAQQPGIEGRVGKPGRRRSRASRRAPTTMLNTDTANFRSMVQQFTGIPSGPYSGISNIHYSLTQPVRQTTSLMSFALLQQQQQQQQREYQAQNNQQQQQQTYHHHQFTAESASLAAIGSVINDSNDIFDQGFSNYGTNSDMAGDGFSSDSLYSQMMPIKPTSTSNRADDGYFF